MQLNRLVVAPLAVAAALAAAPAFAGVELILGNTTNSDTFTRGIADALTGTVTELSTIGSDVRYDAFSFSVTTSGAYTFSSRALGGWDNYLFLYQGGFNAGNALSNVVLGNDDLDGQIGRSGFTLNLQTGKVYTLVTTGFENDDFGRYLNRFSGAGDITSPVPEPGAAAMLLAGLAALGFVARRRSA